MEPQHHPSSKTCRICGQPLTVHQLASGRLCGQIGCRTQWASRMAMERERRHERDENHARSLAYQVIDSLVRENRMQRRANFQVATVPASRKNLRLASEERQEIYREHFERLLVAWQEEQQEQESNAPGNEADSIEQPEDQETGQLQSEPADDGNPTELFGQACATCRGDCCIRGGTHAFQDLDTIRRWFAVHPEATIDDCREAYFSRLKSHSIEGSCVFHGIHGCELPRDWRGDVCNDSHCPSLVRIRQNHQLNNRPISVIVAMEPGRPIRLNVVRSETGERLEPEVEIRR